MTEAHADRRAAHGSHPPDGPGRGPARWKVVFAALLLLGALGAVAWVLLGSRLLVVRHVEVTGADLVSPDRVTAAAGVRLGTPMARLDAGAVEGRVERLREVESARVERHWPGTVRVVVRERVPVAVFARGGVHHVLDRHGVTIADGEARPTGLPTLTAASPGPSDPATLAALAVVSGLPERLGGRLAEVEATGPEEVTLHLRGGRKVVWGAADRAEEKIRLLDALWRTAAGRAIRTVDVSSPGVLKTK